MQEKPLDTIHPSLQFLILIGITLGCMFVGILIGIAIIIPIYGFGIVLQLATFDASIPGLINSIWILQITSTTVPLFVGPFIFARFVVKDVGAYLLVGKKIPVVLFILVFLTMLFSTAFMEWLVNINQKMTFPHWAQGIFNWMLEKEDEAAKETLALFQMKTFGAMLFNLLVVGLLTAIAEEFLFRGCIQTIFTRWTKNIHWGIWITAILFSAFHLEFFGFLPRLLLGAIFGYFAAYSGSIWPAVLGHFINNGSIVVITYLFQQKVVHLNPDDQHMFNYVAYALSLLITVFLLMVYRNIAQSKKALPV